MAPARPNRVPHAASAFSRREVLGTAVVALGVGAIAGCGSGSQSSGAAAAAGRERTDDVEILNGALDIEHLAIATYAAAIPHLRASDASLARRVLEHERAHAAALAALVREFGATPNSARSSYPLRRPRRRSDALGFLAEVENTAIAYYVDALPKLSGAFRHVVLGVVASEAEHLATLRMALGLSAAPDAFVWGRP